MAIVTYIESNGTRHDVEVEAGLSVMEGAVRNLVPGINADCGGACACATCHVFVDAAWRGRTGEASEMEMAMLEVVDDRRDSSRLGCQIRISDELDGLVVELPEKQG